MVESEKKILLVGCGNIGSRHLQGIVKLKYNLHIDIIEPNEEATTLGKTRLAQVPFDKTKVQIDWHKSFDTLKETSTGSDLVINATLSPGRVDLIKSLLKMGHKRFIIEKMICQSNQEYAELLKNIKSHSAKAWVNTPNRYNPFYQKMKELVCDPEEIIHLSVTTGNEGLGCNAIHTIDFLSWLTNSYKVHLNGDFLLNQLLPNKRGAELVEFLGTIIGTAGENESVCIITYLPYQGHPFVTNLVGKGKHFVIDEKNNLFFMLKGDESWKTLKYEQVYVSNTTTLAAADIIEKDESKLPTLEQSSQVHAELFRIFNAHIKKVTGKQVTLCPIT